MVENHALCDSEEQSNILFLIVLHKVLLSLIK